MENRMILTTKNTFTKEKTSGYIKEYKGNIERYALCVINKILSSAVEEYQLSFPLKEIFVMAEPDFASQIIFELKSRARLFTVVSSVDTLGKKFDELYFKYGTVIRHIPSFNNPDWENSIVIKYEDTCDLKEWIKCPVISFDDARINSKTLIVRDMSVKSEKTRHLNELLSINGGFDSFCVMGQMPDDECIVNVKEESGKIYSLMAQDNFS